MLPREFPLPIWPWRPWWPWWDCGANIIFKVTQNCGGQLNTIVNETFADTRWNAPVNLSVTLAANSQACCAYSCPEPCPDGDCLVPSDICQINVGSIGGNVGNVSSPAQIGLFDPGVQDRPFAGAVTFYGIFGSSADVDYYEFLYSTTGAPGSYVPVPIPAVQGFNRSVLVVKPGPVFTWPLVPFNPQLISDGVENHYVIETIRHYEANNGAQVWDSATHDLLEEVISTEKIFPNGVYYFQLKGYQRPGYAGNLTDPEVLPVCDPNRKDPAVLNYWVVNLDNQAPGNTDPSGQPCGLHICTDQPTSDILQVAIGATTVAGCGVACVNPSDLLTIDFVAYDPDAFLQSYSLELLFGVDQSVDLLNPGSFTTWTLDKSSIAPAWVPVPGTGPHSPHDTLVGPDYARALAQGAASPAWSGGAMRLTVNASSAFPELPCAYLLQLNVYKRPIVNCLAAEDVQNNVSFQSFTVQACPQPS